MQSATQRVWTNWIDIVKDLRFFYSIHIWHSYKAWLIPYALQFFVGFQSPFVIPSLPSLSSYPSIQFSKLFMVHTRHLPLALIGSVFFFKTNLTLHLNNLRFGFYIHIVIFNLSYCHLRFSENWQFRWLKFVQFQQEKNVRILVTPYIITSVKNTN